MPRQEHCESDNCPEHSGQVEKIKGVSGKLNLVLWLLGILIGLIVTLGAALYGSLQAVNITLATFSAKVNTLEAKIQSLEASDGRMTERIDRLERTR